MLEMREDATRSNPGANFSNDKAVNRCVKELGKHSSNDIDGASNAKLGLLFTSNLRNVPKNAFLSKWVVRNGTRKTSGRPTAQPREGGYHEA